MQADDEGQYVTWRDYAWLLAENQRLQAEVERLIKAGDAMALNLYIPIRHEIYNELLSEWYAAKEGKQS